MWTTIPSVFVLPTVHVPVLLGLRRWRGGCKPLLLFLVVGIVLEVVPTALASVMFLGSVEKVITRSALYLHVMFAVSGGVLALGFVLCQSCGRAGPSSGFEVIPKPENVGGRGIVGTGEKGDMHERKHHPFT